MLLYYYLFCGPTYLDVVFNVQVVVLEPARRHYLEVDVVVRAPERRRREADELLVLLLPFLMKFQQLKFSLAKMDSRYMCLCFVSVHIVLIHLSVACRDNRK